MLKLKLQYFVHLMGRTDSMEKSLMLGKIEGERRRGWQGMRWLGWHYWLDGHEFEQALGVGDGQGSMACCSLWGLKESDMTDWTELNEYVGFFFFYLNYFENLDWIIILWVDIAHLNLLRSMEGFLGSSNSKQPTCNAGDLGSIPGFGRFPGEGHGNPLQYSCWENSMDRGAWQATVYGVAISQTQLSD